MMVEIVVEIVVEIAVKSYIVKPGWHSILYNRPSQRQTKRPWCSILYYSPEYLICQLIGYSVLVVRLRSLLVYLSRARRDRIP